MRYAMFVVEGERFVVIINLRHHRVAKILVITPILLPRRGRILPLHRGPSRLATLPDLPSFSDNHARFGFDVVKPCVLHTFASGQTFLQVTEQVWQPIHLSRLRPCRLANVFSFFRLLYLIATSSSSQLTFFILRIMMNSSRFSRRCRSS